MKNELQHRIIHATSDIALQLRHINEKILDIEEAAKDVPDCSPMIRVKNIKVMRELIVVPLHPMLKEIFFWTCEQWPGQIVVTSGYRKGDAGVHGRDPLRGKDLSSREFNNPRQVEFKINQEWDYGKINPKTGQPYQVCMYHRTVLCKKCGYKFEVDPDIGVISSTKCGNCHATKEHLKDFGPHFHLQSRDETKRREQ